MSVPVSSDSRIQTARGRNRNQALSVLLPHIMGVLQRYGSASNDRGIAVQQHAFDISAHKFPDAPGHCLSVYHNKQKVLSAYTGDYPNGNYLNKTVHIMGWKRGDWERDIFERFPCRPIELRATRSRLLTVVS
jgi:hypothetical protein